MRDLKRNVDGAFDQFIVNGDIYEFAIDMLELGRKCVKKDSFRFVLEEIYNLEGKHPKHISFKQSARYLMAKGKKKRQGKTC